MLQCGLILIGDGVIFLALDMGDISLVRALSATVCALIFLNNGASLVTLDTGEIIF